MGRRKYSFPDREKACYKAIYDRLDLGNINWGGQEYIIEYCALERVARAIGFLMRYETCVDIGGGKVITNVAYWHFVKKMEYTPLLAKAYKRRELNDYPWQSVIPLPKRTHSLLLNDIYYIVKATASAYTGKKSKPKFDTDQPCERYGWTNPTKRIASKRNASEAGEAARAPERATGDGPGEGGQAITPDG